AGVPADMRRGRQCSTSRSRLGIPITHGTDGRVWNLVRIAHPSPSGAPARGYLDPGSSRRGGTTGGIRHDPITASGKRGDRRPDSLPIPYDAWLAGVPSIRPNWPDSLPQP